MTGLRGERVDKKDCVHPFDRLHWTTGGNVYCNACDTTLKREYEEKESVTSLLLSLHSFNKLNKRVLLAISTSFHIDAFEICSEYGITYNI